MRDNVITNGISYLEIDGDDYPTMLPRPVHHSAARSRLAGGKSDFFMIWMA